MLMLVSCRSSDSAKYTNKSSGTSVLSGNFNTTSFHTKFYSGTKHRENERQSHGSVSIKTAPVHKKVVASFAHNDSNNHIINRFINNNNSQAHNNHYSLNLKRHAETHNAKNGVGCISTLTSPYAGYGVEKQRGTKSDIGGVPLDQSTASRRMHQKKSILQKSALSSVHSDMSLYNRATFKDSHDDIINNNDNSPMNSAITFSKTGSKLLYTNKHRLGNSTHSNVNYDHAQVKVPSSSFGPLIYKNDRDNGNWKRSPYDNPLGAVSWKRFRSHDELWVDNKTAWSGSETNRRSSSLTRSRVNCILANLFLLKLFWFISHFAIFSNSMSVCRFSNKLLAWIRSSSNGFCSQNLHCGFSKYLFPL